MRVGFVEWPENLEPSGAAWSEIASRVTSAKLDLLVTNELPFGPWVAGRDDFDRGAADACVAIHAAGLESLIALQLPAVLSSRAAFCGERLKNEAFILEKGAVRALHGKHWFPAMEGWRESTWFSPDTGPFQSAPIGEAKTGVLLCTEAMFNEQARRYGRQGTHLIALPRATGLSVEKWKTAGAMAAIVSGSYVISSNRVGQSQGSPEFGGVGFAFGPDGVLLASTSAREPLAVIEVDLPRAARQKLDYPCNVAE